MCAKGHRRKRYRRKLIEKANYKAAAVRLRRLKGGIPGVVIIGARILRVLYVDVTQHLASYIGLML